LKVSYLLKIARQVEGDFIFINVIKAHSDSDKLWRWFRQNQNDLQHAEKIGGVDCCVEYGITEDVEVDVELHVLEEEIKKLTTPDPAHTPDQPDSGDQTDS